MPQRPFGVFLLLFALAAIFYFGFSPPIDFPSGKTIIIEPGSDLTAISSQLAKEGVIRFSAANQFLVRTLGGEKGILAGHYFFARPVWAPVVAWRLVSGTYNLKLIKVTIPEGLNVKEIGQLLASELKDFNQTEFVYLASPLEGYLFPDTYFFPPDIAPAEVFNQLRNNFYARLKEIQKQIDESGLNLTQLVTMASLIEEEAAQTEDRRLISGILWKRLDSNRPLQVDAAFDYTYRYRGLPPGPISNPGLEALLAAINPMPSAYWFYLSDKDGKIHYARNFAEHQLNIKHYLE